MSVISGESKFGLDIGPTTGGRRSTSTAGSASKLREPTAFALRDGQYVDAHAMARIRPSSLPAAD